MSVPPAWGTDSPLDNERIDALLKLEPTPAAMLPGSTLLPHSVQLDALRLGWIWQVVADAAADTDDEWIGKAADAIDATAATYANWPLPFATGPALEAQALARISRDELEVIAARRGRITSFLSRLYARPDREDYSAIKNADIEALSWLAREDAECDLAGNRFDERSDAVDFIRRLYHAGATRVLIASESVRRERRKSWYADAIRVALPVDAAQRAELVGMLNVEARNQGFDEEEDTGQSTLYMWWD